MTPPRPCSTSRGSPTRPWPPTRIWRPSGSSRRRALTSIACRPRSRIAGVSSSRWRRRSHWCPSERSRSLVALLLRHQAALDRLDDPQVAGRYHFLLGRGHLFLGDQRQASHHLELGLAAAERGEDDSTRGCIHYVLAQHAAMSGRPRQGLEHGRRAIALLKRAAQPWWIGPAYWAVGLESRRPR